MAILSTRTAHSAEVEMHLLLNGSALRIAQLGPDFLIMDEAVEHAPARGEIVVVVDGVEERWPVDLPEGLHSGERVRILNAPELGEHAGS